MYIYNMCMYIYIYVCVYMFRNFMKQKHRLSFSEKIDKLLGLGVWRFNGHFTDRNIDFWRIT